MIYENKVALHNVAELVPGDRAGALRLQRVPESLRPMINPGAQQKVLEPAAVEIRFVMEGQTTELVLSAGPEPLEIDLFFGDIDAEQRFVIGETPTRISVSVPEAHAERMATIPQNVRTGLTFSPDVVRMRPMYRGPLYIHEVAGNVRPPRGDELPDRTLLTYGTSITHGASSSRPSLSWPALCARRLGVDLVNLGVGGSCHAEKGFADYIAGRDDWDIAVFGLSVNMVGAGFTIEEFSERVTYLLETVTSRHPEQSVFAISLFPYFGDWDARLQVNAKAGAADFRDALAGAVSNVGTSRLHFVDGRSLLTAPDGLTADMIHPSDHGMIEIAEKLTRQIKEKTSHAE